MESRALPPTSVACSEARLIRWSRNAERAQPESEQLQCLLLNPHTTCELLWAYPAIFLHGLGVLDSWEESRQLLLAHGVPSICCPCAQPVGKPVNFSDPSLPTFFQVGWLLQFSQASSLTPLPPSRRDPFQGIPADPPHPVIPAGPRNKVPNWWRSGDSRHFCNIIVLSLTSSKTVHRCSWTSSTHTHIYTKHQLERFKWLLSLQRFLEKRKMRQGSEK